MTMIKAIPIVAGSQIKNVAQPLKRPNARIKINDFFIYENLFSGAAPILRK